MNAQGYYHFLPLLQPLHTGWQAVERHVNIAHLKEVVELLQHTPTCKGSHNECQHCGCQSHAGVGWCLQPTTSFGYMPRADPLIGMPSIVVFLYDSLCACPSPIWMLGTLPCPTNPLCMALMSAWLSQTQENIDQVGIKITSQISVVLLGQTSDDVVSCLVHMGNSCLHVMCELGLEEQLASGIVIV